MGFWDFMAVAGCTHPRWLEDGPDEMGERTCAVCEQRVVVKLTEALFLKTVDQAMRQHRRDY